MAKGRKHSAATRRRMSLKARGRRNPFYGRHHSAAAKAGISRKRRGKKNPMYGKRHSAAAKRKMRLARLKTLRGGR